MGTITSSDQNKRKIKSFLIRNTRTHNFTEVSSDVTLKHKRKIRQGALDKSVKVKLDALDEQHGLVYTSACPLEGRRSEQQGKRKVVQQSEQRRRSASTQLRDCSEIIWSLRFSANIACTSPYSKLSLTETSTTIRDLFKKTERFQKQIQKY